MEIIDLERASDRLAALVRAVPEGALGRPTPCSEYSVGDLLDHVDGITIAFGGAAVKASGATATMGPAGDASRLPEDWRTVLPERLARLNALVIARKPPAEMLPLGLLKCGVFETL